MAVKTIYNLTSYKNCSTFLNSSDWVFDVHDTLQVKSDCSIPLYKAVYQAQLYFKLRNLAFGFLYSRSNISLSFAHIEGPYPQN